MRQLLIFICLLGLFASCQHNKYDPETYKVEPKVGRESGLREECLTFLNYCDQNKTADIKLFARDWLRTWEGWKTEGVIEYTDLKSCHLSTENRYNVKSIHLAVYTDSVPPVFEAERNFFSTEYEDLVATIRAEFGEPDEEIEGPDGIIYNWHINDSKTLFTIPSHFACSFLIEYRLTNSEK